MWIKKLPILLSFFFLSTLAWAHQSQPSENQLEKQTDTEVVELDGEKIEATIKVKGQLMLYKAEVPAAPPYSESYNEVDTKTILLIGKEDDKNVAILHDFDYKKVLERHLSDDLNLLAKVGTKGYKFADIEKIITEYNSK